MTHKGLVAVLGVLLGACPLEVYGMPGGGGGSGGCNAQPGDPCPGACFEDPSNQHVSVSGGQIHVSLKQCFKDSAISFISVAETDENGNCGTCNKIENVHPGSSFYDFSVPVGTCKKTLCVYVHDGKFRREDPESITGTNCISTDNQLCQLCAYEKIDIDLAGECNDDGDLCTVGQCNAGECVEPPKDCSTTPDNDECKDPECDPFDGECKLVAVPDNPETTCGEMPAHPECQKSVCIGGLCAVVNMNDQGACGSSGATGDCQAGKCNAGVCEIEFLTTDCNLHPAVECNVGKCDGAGACAAHPVQNDPAVSCTLDGTAGECEGEPVCVDGACARQSKPAGTDCTLHPAVECNVGKCDGAGACGAEAVPDDPAQSCGAGGTGGVCEGASVCVGGSCQTGTTSGESCDIDGDLCTVGSCSDAGECVETDIDCSGAVPPGEDGDCQVGVCNGGDCDPHPANAGELCGVAASASRKLFEASSCKRCNANGHCVAANDCGGPPPPPDCVGPALGETCSCPDANCATPGVEGPCCEGLCVEGPGNTKTCGGDTTCIDQGGQCVAGATDPICCPGSVCVGGTCVECEFGCSQCPGSSDGVCTDVGANQPAQATCGDDTCTSVCELICELNLNPGETIDPSNCSNQSGGNCQNVFTPAGEDYKGGPCCKCTTDCGSLVINPAPSE